MSFVTIIVDQNMCIGAATCVGTTPDFFELDEENRAAVTGPGAETSALSRTFNVTEDQLQLLRLAAEGCPTRAIRLQE